MQSYLWSDGVYRSVPEYQGCRHYGVDTCGAGDGKQILPRTGIPCAVPQANACPQLCEVTELIIDAVNIEGAHHKQWYLEQIAVKLGIELPEHEKGIIP
jgi:hypothetical protein